MCGRSHLLFSKAIRKLSDCFGMWLLSFVMPELLFNDILDIQSEVQPCEWSWNCP